MKVHRHLPESNQAAPLSLPLCSGFLMVLGLILGTRSLELAKARRELCVLRPHGEGWEGFNFLIGSIYYYIGQILITQTKPEGHFR